MQDDWPTFSQELARKTATALERIVDLTAAGKLNPRDTLIASSFIYDVTSGLIPKDLSEVVAAVHKNARENLKSTARDTPTKQGE